MRRAVGVVLVALLGQACGSADTQKETPRGNDVRQVANGPRPVLGPIRFAGFAPPDEEKYPKAKQLAADVAQQVTTYARGATADEVARGLGLSATETGRLAEAIDPLVRPDVRSGGKVIYPQLSGVTKTTFGAMVVVRQVLEHPDGRRESETRVLDVRLRRQDGPWALDRVVSVGGRRRPRPPQLSSVAARVLDDQNITLTDSARWDIYDGSVDEGLLRRLAALAGDHEISVSVLAAGHPRNVWQTDRRSAHTDGYAVDVYAVDGRLVVRQSSSGSPAYDFAKAAVSGGARQVGSPWDLGKGSFADDVHADHVHIQQESVPGRVSQPAS